LALSALVCLGRQTLTGLLTTSGRINCDWSADYRLFSHRRFDPDSLFGVARKAVCEMIDPDRPLVVSMDDTLLRKSGKKIHGASWRRDPLGPRFQTNLVWAQRFIQISAALPDGTGPSWARMIPIALQHAPSPKRPRKNDSPDKIAEYNKSRKASVATIKGAKLIEKLRSQMDCDESNCHRDLICVVDGGYTNQALFKKLPHKCHAIGRLRKDAKIYRLPEAPAAKTGRKKKYGDPLPTPEQILRDDDFPWQHIEAWAAGRLHQFRVKSIGPIRWRKAGTDSDLRLVIIAPLHYRLSAKSRLLYREPAFLICSNADMPLQDLLQNYIWRWDIENNFRDEKSILGMGKAQVWHHRSVEQLPLFIAASYALLLLAATIAFPSVDSSREVLFKPAWQKRLKPVRLSTQSMISILKSEIWKCNHSSFSHFANSKPRMRSPRNWIPNLHMAAIYSNH